jgi:ubiquinone/menaquinone biosynthesis C-methylase UbiE
MHNVEAQYKTDQHLQTRIQTHSKFTVGQPLEDLVDLALQLKTNQSLLDLGTASGAFPIRLRNQGHTGRLVGLDFSSGMIELAKQPQAEVEFVIGNAMELPFADHSFNVVTARHMLYHVPDMNKALLEVKRVLKPDGRFLALTNANGYLTDYWAVIEETLKHQSEFDFFIKEHLTSKYFHLDLHQQIVSVFGSAELTIIDQHLEFTDFNAPLAYWNSMQSGFEIPIQAWADATAQLENVFSSLVFGKPWRIWKGIAFIGATRAE